MSAARTGGGFAVRTAALPGGRWAATAFVSGAEPDGARLGPGVDPTQYPADCRLWDVGPDEHGRLRVDLADWACGDVRDTWFVVIPGEAEGRPVCHLVAYSTPHLPAGTVVTNATFFTLPVHSDEQRGAVRWFTDDGLIDQIYVTPDNRQQGLARVLIYATTAMQVHHDWPGRIHVGGRRTDLGEQAAADPRHPGRVAPRTVIAEMIDPITGERTR